MSIAWGSRVLDLEISAMSSTGLRALAHSFLEELSRRTGYTASIAVLEGVDVLYVDRERGSYSDDAIDLDIRAGSRLPVYCTALGKALLVGLDEVDARELLGGVDFRERVGPNMITSKRSFWTEVAYVRAGRIAVDDEEFAAGLVAIALPVRGEHGKVVAAVGLEAHASMIAVEDLRNACAPQLAATAHAISARLGYRRGDEVG